MRAWILALAALACAEPPPGPEAPPPQARPVEVEQPTDRKGLVQVAGEWEMPFSDPASMDELAVAVAGFDTLRPPEQKLLYRVLNVVPAACAPCEGKPLARCAVATPPGCENVPRLVQRARRLILAQEPAEKVREAVSYPDAWADLPDDRAPMLDADGPVRVVVWLDPTSPFSAAATASIGKMPASGVSLVVRYHVSPDDPGARAVALAAIAASRQGHGLAFLQAAEAWRAGARDARREGRDPFADGGLEGVAAMVSADGFDVERWRADRADAATSAQLEADIELGRATGVRSVPTWFVDGYRLRGAQSDLALGRVIGLGLDDAAASGGG